MDIEDVKKRFKDHELKEIFIREDLKVFEFRKPDTIHLYQRWIIDRGTLIVQGDCYDAIYRWNDSSINLEFLSNCNLSYFSEKCLADKDGRNQDKFDEEGCSERLKEIAIEQFYWNNENNEDFDEDGWEEADNETKFELMKKSICENGNIMKWEFDDLFYHEFEHEVYDTMNNNENIFGTDTWEYNFRVKTHTPYFHLGALKMCQEKYPNAF